ncbi:hypothetical protein CNAG_05559 [Cryptococcus neoformans var. grubii H99]|uniref:Sec39 domain-containing protein n=1 Tax=Cryptococcus neoformans (strain H99 / ATCC 208821 / CBS 10515 / FGSC 9487) TaxID=235443 RepID=J9VZW4_CRYN9|nr:hypothetical protein CNAG_05559 [Cryptococcus neoformans var. grubii H99]AFR98986.1 hypothetical protein CNAG_05559 [Cryptococcus neoformans var. grubii H99]AUB29212.1 hypothetical protein CKF44_05559 [Cryptococcus neoformans var. grubii]|eukprot:XP_012053846.1 hypothetical protein CNAG_05559 [Cryptococcus neoformans var. grubii H99]
MTEDELLKTLPTPFTSASFIQTLITLPDSEAIGLCFNLLISGKVNDVVLAKDVIGQGLEKGLVYFADVLASTEEVTEEELEKVVGAREETLRAYIGLEEMRRRLDTWEIISPKQVAATEAKEEALGALMIDKDERQPLSQDDMELGDPWGGYGDPKEEDPKESTLLDDPWLQNSSVPASESTFQVVNTPAAPSITASETADPLPIAMSEFLSQPIVISALSLASASSLQALKLLCQHQHRELYPYRFNLLEAVPGWVSPSDLESVELLPAVDSDDNERWVPPVVTSAIVAHQAFPQIINDVYLPSSMSTIPPTILLQPCQHAVSPSDLAKWYTAHVLSLDEVGILDIQLAWVQHGASLGVPSLDSLGEDLTLLSRLVYDANLTQDQHVKWTLGNWMLAKESDIIAAYLSSSTPESIAGDVRRLVMPYLYVLESRAERAGIPSSNLISDSLNSTILSLPLRLALPLFEASKATLPPSERVIRNDLDVARLALACLYGSQERGGAVWSTMSSIFECLPVWELTGEDAEDEELTSTTLDSISNFLRPTSASTSPPSKSDILFFFQPLPFASLSRALDILDVQLESGEILARWGVEKRLGELLGMTGDQKGQMELAERLVRQGEASVGKGGDDRWRRLWNDMERLSSGEGLLKGALGTLTQQARGRVYFDGILRSGDFEIAKKMLKMLQGDGAIDDAAVEEVVLKVSKDFYVCADSCNIYTGNMKLAYDALSVAPSTPATVAERQYIEATSRLSSFSTFTLSPREIRHDVNPLSLLSTVLSDSSSDAYRLPDLMLDLAEKLGCRNEIDHGLVWGMVGRAAIAKEDWTMASKAVGNMVQTVKKSQSSQTAVKQEQQINHIAESGSTLRSETWALAHALSSQPEFSDIPAKLKFVSSAIELCPASELPSIIETFRQIEKGRIRLDEAAKRRRMKGIAAPQLPSEPSIGVSNVAAVQERVLGSRTAAKAAKLALDIGGRLTAHRQLPSPALLSSATFSSPFAGHELSRPLSRNSATGSEVGSDGGYKVGGSLSSGSAGARDLFEHLGRDEAERVRKGARRALVRGVGWLLGADESEIAGVEQ